MTEAGYSIAVFPYLKTSGPVFLGGVNLRSTLDTEGLPDDQVQHVRTIAAMLFLQGQYQISSATYAIVPWANPEEMTSTLRNLQAIIAYCYCAPHPTLGTPFLQYEESSMLIFTPGPVIGFIVQPDHNVRYVGSIPPPVPDERHELPGYTGLYNFQHHFWVCQGSRVYPPVPHPSLNLSQDLACDTERFFRESTVYRHLPLLLARPMDANAERMLRAITWFNRANSSSNGDETNLVMLAVAFETLLEVPEDKKTERLADAIALLLGRVPRLETWASQFYDARSAILHEGRAVQLRFAATDEKKPKSPPLYNSLLAYGREIFQLCTSTLLLGAHLAARVGLGDKLITNQERFANICKVLSDTTQSPAVRLHQIAPTVRIINGLRFVAETDLRIQTMLDAVRLAAKCLLTCATIEPALAERLNRLATTPFAPDGYGALDALRQVTEATRHTPQHGEDGPRDICLQLCYMVWMSTFQYYFWRQQEREKKQASNAQ